MISIEAVLIYQRSGGKDVQQIKDIQVALSDPAARNVLKFYCVIPIHAVVLHRFAHWLHRRRLKLIARMVSQFNRFLTGGNHPVRIGGSLYRSYGRIIGETTVIGDMSPFTRSNLGTGKETGKRHPTIGNNVVISCGAKILGPFHVETTRKSGPVPWY